MLCMQRNIPKAFLGLRELPEHDPPQRTTSDTNEEKTLKAGLYASQQGMLMNHRRTDKSDAAAQSPRNKSF
jgi:hypothetical protein